MTSQEPDAVDAALLERYRQASSAEGLEPTEAVRAAILAEGRRIAQQRAAAPPLRSLDTARPAANQSRFRLAAFGTFGVAILAALLIVPRWLISPASRPQMAATQSAPALARDAAALREAAAPKENVPAAAATPPASAAPAPAAASRLAKSEASPSAEARQFTAGTAAKRPTQSSTDQLAEITPPVAGSIFGQPSNADHSNSDVVTAARTAQNRSLSASAGARPAAAPPPTASSSQTPLMVAVAAGDLARATMLLDQHAPTEDRDDLGRTPLLIATAEGQVEIVRLLLAHGADPNATDKTGGTPLQLANRSQFTEIAQLLEDAGAR
jgi:hypothetical protein